jgi:hypothetical protein
MQSTIDADAALSENQAAEFLGLSVRTLQAWRVRGGGPRVRGGGPRYLKIGRAVRYQRRELVAYQQLHTVGSTAESNSRSDAR